MTFAICVLWRPGDPWRERLWAFCRARWEAAGLKPTTAPGAGGLWAARNEAAAEAGEWDAALFADADIALAEPEQAWVALEQAAAGRSYVAFSQLVDLSAEGTEQALAGAPLAECAAADIFYDSWIGAFAIGRPLWDDLGGYDERFAPFSGQDVAIIHAAATLGTLERVPGDAYHLWHERGGDQPGHPPAGSPLWPRYQAATGKPRAMRALLRR